MRKLLLAVPWLAACPAEVPDAAPATAPSVAPEGTQSGQAPDLRPAEAPAAVAEAPPDTAPGSPGPLLGAPWTNVDSAGPRPDGRVDTFTFWGWDAAGRHYAFQTVYAGAGAVQCEGSVTLGVVDAATDRFVPDGLVELKHREPEPADGRCDPVDLAAAAEARRPELLARYGIEPGRLVAPARLEGDTPSFEVGARRFQFSFHSASVSRDEAMGGAGAAYTLAWTAPRAAPIEPGTRKRPPVYRYDLQPGLAFVSPTGTHVALVVRKVMVDFEGDRIGFMTNGAPLPR